MAKTQDTFRARNLDPRLESQAISDEASRQATQKLADAGFLKPEDIQAGRVDMGKLGNMLAAKDIDEELHPLLVEKLNRDVEFASLAREQEEEASARPAETETATEEQPAPEGDRLSQLSAEVDRAKAEAEKWKALYGRSENKVGDVRKRLTELESRVQQAPPYMVDSRQLVGKAPDEPITAGDAASLMLSMAAALGNQVRQAKEDALAEMRGINQPGLPADVEAELLEAHPWLESLPKAQKDRAMLDIVQTQAKPAAPAPVAPVTKGPAVERARATVRESGYIEQSNRSSTAERTSTMPQVAQRQQDVAKLKELLARPGGAEAAEQLFAALGAGPTDDREVPPLIAVRH